MNRVAAMRRRPASIDQRFRWYGQQVLAFVLIRIDRSTFRSRAKVKIEGAQPREELAMTQSSENKKETLKQIIRQLHAGAKPEEVKERFRDVLEGTTPLEITKIEQELVEEGMPRDEIRSLCDVHLVVFREQLEKEEEETPPESPIHILKQEHEIILSFSEELNSLVDKVHQAEDKGRVTDEVEEIKRIAKNLLDAEKHYLREENVLFPLLEKHGIKEPPAVMWTEHNQIRKEKKELHGLINQFDSMAFKDFSGQLGEAARSLANSLSSHFYKENNILFPAALKVVTAEEWADARRDFDEIGYCCFTPKDLVAAPKAVEEVKVEAVMGSHGLLKFETGSLSKEELEGVLNTLPVDITFVDKEDAVKYFSKGEDRIFVRTKAVIGRKVQQCHPQKSVHIVNKIVEAFKTGKKNVAEFWIQLGDRLVHIRYFAVRDKDGRYLGTMEVTQDITDIKKIEGERRLLDWKD